MQHLVADYKAANTGKAGRARHCFKRVAFGIRLIEAKARIHNCAIDFEPAVCDLEKIASAKRADVISGGCRQRVGGSQRQQCCARLWSTLRVEWRSTKSSTLFKTP